jgi:DNA-binding XRE family transcriptional regulator
MNTSADFVHDELLNPVVDVDMVGVTDDRERPVHVGVELGADVFAFERHAGTISARQNYSGAMGDEKSSGTDPAIQLGVKLELSVGEFVELPGSQLGYYVLPKLDGHAMDTQGLGNAGLIPTEVPDYVFFEHRPSITMLYPQYKNDLQPGSYAEPMETMGDRIRMLRHSKGWTQQQLGDRLGVSKVAVYQWEVGTTSDIKLKTFLKLVEELGTNPQFLLFGHEAPRTPSRKRSQP